MQHPIVDQVLALLEDRDGVLLLSEPGREQLAVALRKHFGKPDLLDAVRTLLAFAFFLDYRKSSPDAAAAVVQVVRGAEQALAAGQVRLNDVVASVAADQEIQRFLAQDSKPQEHSKDAPAMTWLEAMSNRKPRS
jgi:hypothetical protein